MLRRSALTGVFVPALVATFAVTAAAQTPAGPAAPKVRFDTAGAVKAVQQAEVGPPLIGVDFQLMHYSEESAKLGFGFGFGFPWCPTADIIGGINVHRFGYDGGSTTLFSILGGALYRPPTESKVKPFVQGQVGFDRWAGETAFVFEPAGGVEYPINERVNFRVTVGAHIGFWDGDASTGFRAAFGVTMPISSR